MGPQLRLILDNSQKLVLRCLPCQVLFYVNVFIVIQLSKKSSATTAADTSGSIKDESTPKLDSSVKTSLLSVSNILRILAELTRSFVCCAQLVCQHHYYAGQSPGIKEVCNVLQFHFFVHSSNSRDQMVQNGRFNLTF